MDHGWATFTNVLLCPPSLPLSPRERERERERVEGQIHHDSAALGSTPVDSHESPKNGHEG